MAGVTEPASGSVTRSKQTRLAFAEQDVPSELENLPMRSAIETAIPEAERDVFRWRVDVALDSLEVPEEFRSRKLSALSGGWRRLTLIARAWALDPDILLMDEPTNHLDLSKIMRLEDWLAHEVGQIPMVIVSHDRRFLDTCTNKTLFLRPRESVSFSYPFARARELLDESDKALLSRKEREQREALRLRQSAHNLRQIGVNNYSAAALRKSIQIAKRAEAIEESMTEVHTEARRDIKITSSDTHAKTLVSLEKCTIEKPGGGSLFTIDSLRINQGDRIALLGRNGTGKTCFIKMLRSACDRTAAHNLDGLRIGPAVKLGYVDQNMSQLPNNEEIGKYVASLIERNRATAALVVAGFPVTNHAQRIDRLSMGQKARLALLALQLASPNFFLMDEPTNHLDIPGQEQLEEEILAHASTGVFVSHDRVFVGNTGTRFIVIDRARVYELDSPEPYYEAMRGNIALTEVIGGRHPL